MSRYDVIIFGGSGYTGQYVVEHFAKIADEEKVTWAVAGRSAKKLDETLQFIGSVTGKDLSKVEKIIANVDDDESLNAMCKRARVLINCVGPYRLWGDQVIRAAIANDCHHLDISGETIFIDGSFLKFDEEARKKKVFIISAAGADSIPSEMGIEFLMKNTNVDINGIRNFLIFKGSQSGAANYGTWHSAVRAVGDQKMLGPIRRQIYTTPLPKPKYRLPRKAVFYNDFLHSWAVVLPATDRSVAKRSQYFHFLNEKKRPIQVETYLCPKNIFQTIGLVIFGIVFAIMASFKFTQQLLLNHPEFFSFGMFSKEGAPREQVLKRRFELIVEGEAHNGRIEDPNVQHEDPPTRRVACKVSGPEFGYVNCAINIGQCALTILREADKMPQGGGVFPPGYAFSKTSLIDRLQKYGVKFEMLP